MSSALCQPRKEGKGRYILKTIFSFSNFFPSQMSVPCVSLERKERGATFWKQTLRQNGAQRSLSQGLFSECSCHPGCQRRGVEFCDSMAQDKKNPRGKNKTLCAKTKTLKYNTVHVLGRVVWTRLRTHTHTHTPLPIMSLSGLKKSLGALKSQTKKQKKMGGG